MCYLLFVAYERMKQFVSMPVCVHSCTVSGEYTERFKENEDNTYENDTTEYE